MACLAIETGLEDRGDLARFRKPTQGALGVDQLVVEIDLEHPSRTFDQLGLNAKVVSNFSRQTGGSRLVVSDYAVLDGDVWHRFPQFCSFDCGAIGLAVTTSLYKTPIHSRIELPGFGR